MINDRIEQFERPATTAGHPAGQRYTLRRRHVPGARAAVGQASRDARAEVALAFRVLANGIEPMPAQAQAASFYRSSGQAWARSLGVDEEGGARASVAAAFMAMAHGADSDTANAATVRFYRSSGHGWTRALAAVA
jgi:hypothetical protein